MLIHQLSLSNVRNIARAQLTLHPKLNIITGSNGAGKSSLLEALSIISAGKSFRTANIRKVIKEDADALTVFCTLQGPDGIQKIGLQRDLQGGFKAKRDGKNLTRLVDVSKQLPIFIIYPGFYEQVAEKRANRLKVFDWGVFHVEHNFFELWSKYSKTLKQRNALLKQIKSRVKSNDQLLYWNKTLSALGNELNKSRLRYIDSISTIFQETLSNTKLKDSNIQLSYYRGFNKDHDFLSLLEETSEKDILRGTTQIGPHRADVRFLSSGQNIFEKASRGQQKMLVNALLISMIKRFSEDSGRASMVCLDDLPSELDEYNQEDLIAALSALPMAQILITAITENSLPEAISGYNRHMFHVEHGMFQQRDLQ